MVKYMYIKCEKYLKAKKLNMCVSDHPTDSPFSRRPTQGFLLCDSKFFYWGSYRKKLSKSDHFERSYKVLKTNLSTISAKMDTFPIFEEKSH